MLVHNEQATAAVSPHAYDDEYYFAWPGQLNKFSEYKGERDVARAQAMAEAVRLQPWDKVLDFGCGVGAMTAAFHAAGYPTAGVDFSPRAIANTIPEARGLTSLTTNCRWRIFQMIWLVLSLPKTFLNIWTKVEYMT